MSALLLILLAAQPVAPARTQVPRPAQQALPPGAVAPRAPATPPPPPGLPPVAPRRFGRFDLDQPKEQLARLPDLKDCAEALSASSGHADCAVPRDPDRIGRVQIAWEDSRPGGEIVALRLRLDSALAPALTDLGW